MRFMLAAVALSFALMTTHQATAPPKQHDPTTITSADAHLTIATPIVNWAKVLNLDTSAVLECETAFVIEEVNVAYSDAVLSSADEAVPNCGGTSLHLASTSTVLRSLCGGACADERATFEDC